MYKYTIAETPTVGLFDSVQELLVHIGEKDFMSDQIEYKQDGTYVCKACGFHTTSLDAVMAHIGAAHLTEKLRADFSKLGVAVVVPRQDFAIIRDCMLKDTHYEYPITANVLPSKEVMSFYNGTTTIALDTGRMQLRSEQGTDHSGARMVVGDTSYYIVRDTIIETLPQTLSEIVPIRDEDYPLRTMIQNNVAALLKEVTAELKAAEVGRVTIIKEFPGCQVEIKIESVFLNAELQAA